MRRRLVREHVGDDALLDERVEQVDRVALDADRDRFLFVPRLEGASDSRFEIRRELVEITLVQPPLDARAVDFRDEAGRLVHRGRKRLGAAHPAEAGRHDETPGERVAEVLLREAIKQ